MISVQKVATATRNFIQMRFIEETQGVSKASAFTWAMNSKDGIPKYRTTLLSRGLQQMFEESGRDKAFFKKEGANLMLNAYWSTDEESGTKFLVHQIRHKDEPSTSLYEDSEDFFGASEDVSFVIDNVGSAGMSEQEEFEQFLASFQADTRDESERANVNANAVVAGKGVIDADAE